ncbi:MerR family transcriptional regulator [Niveispirillum sp. KHB5.9]|uniref:MerR family transcriptional regulator n=1 Tax=Niveispirillum sp. KHB5.9 TaxID=3400269 RepID=UPI003A8A18AA
MSLYTVSQLARLAGVSVRTLHHYDHIGLLRPAATAENGYRQYGREELLRLQQILLHRELGMPLAEIARVLDAPDFDRRAALHAQRRHLLAEAERYRQLVATIDRTITLLEGEDVMDAQALYQGFSPEKQTEHEDWLVGRYGAAVRTDIALSRQAMGRLDRGAQMRELADIENAAAQAMRDGTPAGDARLDGLLARHLEWVAASWGRRPDADAYAGLAEMYRSHPDFRSRYEALAPGLADYLPDAMEAYAIRMLVGN